MAVVWYLVRAEAPRYKVESHEINLDKFRKSLNAWHRQAMG